MARRARRYDDYSKLNVKKVIAVIVFVLVIVMFFIGIKFLLNNNSRSTSGRVETLGYYTAYDNGKWGVINSYGEMILEPQYDEMIIIPDNNKDVFICAYDINYKENTYKTKAVNSKGKDIIQGYDKVEAIQNFDEKQKVWYESNVLRVQKNGKYGLVDFSGKELLSAEYEKIEPIKGIKNSLLISKDDGIGLCDDSGNIIIEPKYKDIQNIENDYKNGYIVIDKDNKYGIIGFDKSTILECKYDEIKGIYSDDLFVIKKDKKYIVIDKEGQTVIDNKFDEVEDIRGEYIVVKKNGKYGVLNKAGETKVKFEYEKINIINSNYCIAQKDEMYGIIDLNRRRKIKI